MLWPFFLNILAIGSLTFGGGYAMISALQQDLVVRNAWLTSEEFSNSVAVGQITPGPLMIMVAFMGYKIAGFPGALLGTLGLFLPSFVLVLFLSRYYQRLQGNPVVEAALKGINAAVVGLLAAATLDLARSSFSSVEAVVIAVTGILLMGPARREPAWVLLSAGLAGAWFLR